MAESDYVYAVICEASPYYCEKVMGVPHREGELVTIDDFYQFRQEAQEKAEALSDHVMRWIVLHVPRYRVDPSSIRGTPENVACREAAMKPIMAQVEERRRKREQKRAYWRDRQRESRANRGI